MSSRPAAPRRASVTTWARTSASEWPRSPLSAGGAAPPRAGRAGGAVGAEVGQTDGVGVAQGSPIGWDLDPAQDEFPSVFGPCEGVDVDAEADPHQWRSRTNLLRGSRPRVA